MWLAITVLGLLALLLVIPASYKDFRKAAERTFNADLYAAEAGERVRDPEAEDGNAIRATRTGWVMIYGPDQFPSGAYRVDFRFRCEGDPSTLNAPIAAFDVAEDKGRKRLASNALEVDSEGCGSYRVHSLSFVSHAQGGLEIRCFSFGKLPLWLDSVAIRPID